MARRDGPGLVYVCSQRPKEYHVPHPRRISFFNEVRRILYSLYKRHFVLRLLSMQLINASTWLPEDQCLAFVSIYLQTTLLRASDHSLLHSAQPCFPVFVPSVCSRELWLRLLCHLWMLITQHTDRVIRPMPLQEIFRRQDLCLYLNECEGPVFSLDTCPSNGLGVERRNKSFELR